LVKIIAIISEAINPFFPESLKRRSIRYLKFLEKMVDGLAISTGREARDYSCEIACHSEACV
jgi:hypothetical protein